MQTPFFVRPLTADEQATIETKLRSLSPFTVRRCQILLASAKGQSTTTIAHDLRSESLTPGVRALLNLLPDVASNEVSPDTFRIPYGKRCNSLVA